MNETDCRDILLVKAFESVPHPSWPADDHVWASESAAREAGADASGEGFVVQRARLAAARLRDRDPGARAISQASKWPGPIWMAVPLAFCLGLAADAASAGHFINLLAPPMLGLLAWNLALYTTLLVAPIWPWRLPHSPLGGLWAAWLARRGLRRLGGPSAVAARFARSWATVAATLNASRLAALLHACAAAIAIGAIAGLYLRGLVFEYRAGWSSTFLEPAGVAALLRTLLAPASLLTGIELPDAARVAAMRMPAATGERAGDWIHLQAATLAAFVIAPRSLLSLRAWLRSRRLAQRLPLPLTEPYFTTLLRGRGATAAAVQVLPYNVAMTQVMRDTLAALLAAAFGSAVRIRIAPNTEFGDETPPVLPQSEPAPDWVAVLLRFSATPEREIQLHYVEAVRAALPAGVPLTVMIDDSGFRARFDDPKRHSQRAQAWRRLFDAEGIAVLLLTLAPEQFDASLDALLASLGTASALSR